MVKSYEKMFAKKCRSCGRKVEKDFDFCPFCGFNVKKEKEGRNLGFLGKDDNFELPEFGLKMPFGFDRIFSSLLKQIDGQFREIDKEMGKDFEKEVKRKPVISRGISISISSGTGKNPEIKVRGFGPGFDKLIKQEEKPIKLPKEISEEKIKKLAKLPREEALTQVRRLSNKIIYEISLPEVKNKEDIIINKLENSIEIKAFSKDKVYFKLLPVNLPILNYKLDKEKLILELKATS